MLPLGEGRIGSRFMVRQIVEQVYGNIVVSPKEMIGLMAQIYRNLTHGTLSTNCLFSFQLQRS